MTIDQDLHVHTTLSLCSNDPDQNPGAIVAWAARRGIRTVCLTNHYWDETMPGGTHPFYQQQDTAHYEAIRTMLPVDNLGVRLLLGCETEYLGGPWLGLSPERAKRMDFINLPITHLHFEDFVRPRRYQTPAQVAQLWLERFDQALQLDLPWEKVNFVHLNFLLGFEGQHRAILEALPDEALAERFTRCAGQGAKVELNGSVFTHGIWAECPEQHLRMLSIARDCGCLFTFGSDAHHPQALDDVFANERAAELLGLSEAQIFNPDVLV